MTPPGPPPTGPHGSVAEEIAALAEALRTRSRGGEEAAPDGVPGHGPGRAHTHDHDHHRDRAQPPGIDACEICPLCRMIAALHTVSPAAVTALADLVHQAEVTLRALASDLQAREESGAAPRREDIPVDDLDGDVGDDVSDE